MINFGAVPIGAVLPVIFDSFDGGTGASITLTGLAITDVEIFKGTSMTQRTPDTGVVLIDTDGIDIDGITGIHGFSIDTGDNTDAGFFAAGSFYTVVVSAVTIDAQTVNFVAATFRLVEAETTAGRPLVQTAALSANAITATAINADAITAAKIADGAIDAATFAADAITAAKIHSDVTTELQNGLATAAALATVSSKVDAVDDLLDSEMPALTTAVADLPTNAELATALGTADDAVLAALAIIATAIGDVPTAIENADALLDRDMSTGADSGSTTVRTPRQALRFLRNKFSIIAGTLTVRKEDDTTASWTAAVTQTAGNPVSEIDPAGP